MTIVRTTNKMDAIKAYINTWLKDPTVYCANCGETWYAPVHLQESCCEHPQFGRNADHTRACAKQNKYAQETRLKSTGATEDDAIRWGASMPVKLVNDLESYFKGHGEKLFNTPKELHQFLKEFPAFKTCQRV